MSVKDIFCFQLIDKIIKAPYVKLEVETYCYRPFHLELDVWPRLNVDTPRGSCPFDGTLIKGYLHLNIRCTESVQYSSQLPGI